MIQWFPLVWALGIQVLQQLLIGAPKLAPLRKRWGWWSVPFLVLWPLALPALGVVALVQWAVRDRTRA